MLQCKPSMQHDVNYYQLLQDLLRGRHDIDFIEGSDVQKAEITSPESYFMVIFSTLCLLCIHIFMAKDTFRVCTAKLHQAFESIKHTHTHKLLHMSQGKSPACTFILNPMQTPPIWQTNMGALSPKESTNTKHHQPLESQEKMCETAETYRI